MMSRIQKDEENGIREKDLETALHGLSGSQTPAAPAQPILYSVYTPWEKRLIVATAGYAAWFSTLSSFIYFPALDMLASSLSVGVDKINLTITSYMAVATVAPTLLGDLADVLGRRPAFMLCLTLYIIANVAIATSRAWGALLGLRVLQALAISGSFSLAYGVVTDVATPAERGTYVSAVSFIVTIAPSIGPILGGAIAYAAGWRWIFWFLALASGLGLFLVVCFLPETSRSVVSDGSIPPPPYLRLPVPGIMVHYAPSAQPLARTRKMPNPLRSLTILTRRDNVTLIMAVGLLYAAYTCINAALSVLFIEIYHINQWQAGLVYIPFGVGGTISTLFSGKILDGAYKRARTARGLSTSKAVGDDLDNFPIEKARLLTIWVPLGMTIASIVAFGWTLHFHIHMSVPLILHFVSGMAMQLCFSTTNTLLVDKNQGSPSAAQASSNLIRCSMAAIVIAFMQDMIDSMGIGGTYTFVAGLCALAMVFYLVDYRFGTRWRQEWVRKQAERAGRDG